MAKLTGKAKARARKKAYTVRHIAHKKKGAELTTFYWGYKANQGEDGFEFTNRTAEYCGLSSKQAQHISGAIKEASDIQLEHYINNTTQEHYGLTREEFADEEWTRLHQVIDNLRVRGKQMLSFKDHFPDIMIACCAISTLVAAGKIQQDTWNGDNFGYAYTNAKQLEEVNQV